MAYAGPFTLNAATLNATFVVAVGESAATVAFPITGLAASGATLTTEYSDDNQTTWYPLRYMGTATMPGATTTTVDGPITLPAGGHTHLRLRVSTTGTGMITVGSSASRAPRSVNLEGAGTGSGNPLYVTSTPSAGSSSAVTIADGADVTQGAKADAAYTGGTGSFSVIALLKGIYALLTGYQGWVETTTPLAANAAPYQSTNRPSPGWASYFNVNISQNGGGSGTLYIGDGGPTDVASVAVTSSTVSTPLKVAITGPVGKNYYARFQNGGTAQTAVKLETSFSRS